MDADFMRTTQPVISSFRTTYCDSVEDHHVAFAIQLHDSHRQVEWCLAHLREHYPHSRIVLINDGDGRSYLDLVSRWQCTYIRTDRLMSLGHGHLYVQRLLRALLQGDETYLLRIDPDTRIWRRIRQLPAFSSLFGTIETLSESRREEVRVPANVQGGCIGLTRDAAQAILTSGLLTRENVGVNYLNTWARCGAMHRVAQAGRISDDFVLSWAAHQSGIVVTESSEIRSRWRLTPSNDDLEYAITHPHKLSPELMV